MSACPPGGTARAGDTRDNSDTEQNHSTAFAAALIKAQQVCMVWGGVGGMISVFVHWK